ncbi:mycofactocin biosynthesis peptidyl-dipeptidase MftE [Gordonia insulae]|uniref:Mycofactocin system creatinine amidohydrolase family protein MftE n=1 Tax=Gordonia insulae TaxID=2420509 RepID=A0A3G8JTR4_9ACTN|nr:mycofactocin biosynthesis peptidyl-dipeptidase MftE [Gordonia insulae]AZG48313.1 Putative mycofactocin system creatinine amidohydrolase family protein MftE [Gordonia insulae]
MGRRAALGQLYWPELSGRSVTLLVPLGATEQHGPHLPLDTDSRIAAMVATRAAARLGADESSEGVAGPVDSLVLSAPGLNYGASGEHEGFPGTISLGHEALHLMLVEYGRSACRWADRVVFVNGHGGNGPTLVSAVERLRYEGRDIAWYPCAVPNSDAHAGHTETSVLLHFSPDDVTLAQAEAGNVAPIATLLPSMRTGGVAAVSPNGVLGDPVGATAEQGELMAEGVVTGLVDALRSWSVAANGRIG